MMVKVAVKQLRRTWRVWVGALVMVIVGATGITAVRLHLATAGTMPSEKARAIFSLAYGEIVFLIVASVAMLASTARYAVAATRAEYARLQLVGVLPRQVFTIVLVQLLAVGVIGVVFGCGLGIVCAQPMLDYTVHQTTLQQTVPVVYLAHSIVISALIVLVVTLFSGVRSARAASLMPALWALRETEETPAVKFSCGRLIFTLVLAVCTIALAVGIQFVRIDPHQERVDAAISGVAILGILLGLCLISLLAALAPLLSSGFISVWSAIIPMRLSASWNIARRFIQHSGGRSAATLTPVLIAVGLPGILSTVSDTIATGMSSGSGTNSGGLSVILSPALLTTTIGAATIIFMGSLSRSRDFALLVLTGVSRAVIARIVVFESLMYALSSFLLALGVMAVVGFSVSSRFPAETKVTSALGWDVAAVSAGCAWVILCLANLAPVLRYNRLKLVSTT